MKTRTYYAALLLAALSVGLACDTADEPGEAAETAPGAEQQIPPEQEMNPEMMQRMVEAQTIQQQLQPIQQQALQDPELAAQLQSIQQKIDAAMREEAPEAMERMDELRGQVAEAQQARDQERLQALMQEGQSLQQQLQAVQQRIFQRPDIAQPVAAFEAAHRERMIEIDPAADSLLNRMDELVAELSR